MPGLAARDDAVAELSALVDAVRALPDAALESDSACAGWRVGDVVAHVGGVVDAQQAAFVNMLAGSTETPPWSDVPFDPASSRGALDAAYARAVDTYGRVTEAHMANVVPLPFGTFPCENALDIVLLEYGTHRWDIARRELSPATADVVLRLFPGFVAFYGLTPPARPIAFRIEAPSATVDVSVRDGAWVLEPGDARATTVISGSDSRVALYVLGRVGADDPQLTVRGADGAAFKAWFPGP